MDVYEICGNVTGIDRSGVNFLSPADSYQNLVNGYVYRQVLQSRQGIGFFAPRLAPLLANPTRVFGIFEHTLPGEGAVKELLAIDQNFLYRYNTATGIFDQIPFGGSITGYTGFQIAAKDDYISGTSYPTAQFLDGGVTINPAFTLAGGSRFIFCGEGINNVGTDSTIFFYNGIDVRCYTNIADNPNYAAPPEGPLTESQYVIWFNERLNFIVPVINAITYNQGTLYSGIRNISGNGDKFNVAGSGLFQADTYQNITGATILGQIMVHNYNRMAYTMEKTTDAFNPYFGRALPGVLGTNAKFSAVSWDDEVQSLGKTGVLSSDGRQNVRIDNRIPNFTTDDIDQKDFNLIYGGFDRVNGQFLWAYKSTEAPANTQDAVLIRNYEEGSWATTDQRFSVFGQTDLGLDLTWDDIDETRNPAWAQWDTTEEIWDRIGLGVAIQKTLAGDDLGFIYDINQDYDDYFTTISAVAPGSTTTLTVASVGILAGDFVSIANIQGMLNSSGVSGINNFDPDTSLQIGRLWLVLAATPTSITIDCDSSLFTAYVPNTGTMSKVIEFYAETIPFNPYRPQGRRCFVSHVEFLLETNGGNLSVDVFADEQTTPFKQNVLIKPITTRNNQSTEWITMSVDQEANFLTFAMKQTSPAVQVRLKSLRIHCQMGGYTSG